MSTPELSVAIKAAQRMCGRSGGITRPGSVPRSLSRAASTQGLSCGNGGTSGSASISSASSTSLSLGPAMPAPAPALPVVSAPPPTTAAMAHADLAAAVAAMAAAPVSVLPRVASAEHALSALRQATAAANGRLGGSPSATPQPAPVHHHHAQALPQQLQYAHMGAPAGGHAMSAAMLNGAVPYRAHNHL